jgi:hypothetical protein
LTDPLHGPTELFRLAHVLVSHGQSDKILHMNHNSAVMRDSAYTPDENSTIPMDVSCLWKQMVLHDRGKKRRVKSYHPPYTSQQYRSIRNLLKRMLSNPIIVHHPSSLHDILHEYHDVIVEIINTHMKNATTSQENIVK